jgi:hypothetical protein
MIDCAGQRCRPTIVVALRMAVATLPVRRLQVAEAQVGNACAARLAEPRERRDVRADAEQHVDLMAAPFERGAVVRRAEEHQFGQRRIPSVLHLHGVVMGAARHQTAHAVADDDQFVDRHRPFHDQFFKQLGEVLPALGNVTSAVVVQVDRCEAEIACQRWHDRSAARHCRSFCTSRANATSARLRHG